MGNLLHGQEPSIEQNGRPVGRPLDRARIGRSQHGAVLRQVPEQTARNSMICRGSSRCSVVENEQFGSCSTACAERHPLPGSHATALYDDAAHAGERQPLDRGVDGAIQGPAFDPPQVAP